MLQKRRDAKLAATHLSFNCILQDFKGTLSDRRTPHVIYAGTGSTGASRHASTLTVSAIFPQGGGGPRGSGPGRAAAAEKRTTQVGWGWERAGGARQWSTGLPRMGGVGLGHATLPVDGGQQGGRQRTPQHVQLQKNANAKMQMLKKDQN